MADTSSSHPSGGNGASGASGPSGASGASGASGPSGAPGASGGSRLEGRYARILAQLQELFDGYAGAPLDTTARMATICALLHHKMPHYFWTGFYLLKESQLVVGPYQGPVACAVLPGPAGVCWAGIQRGETLVVPDVHAYPGHVACDERSRSEIVVPVRDRTGAVIGVMDVDSDLRDAFGEADRVGLQRIVDLLKG